MPKDQTSEASVNARRALAAVGLERRPRCRAALVARAGGRERDAPLGRAEVADLGHETVALDHQKHVGGLEVPVLHLSERTTLSAYRGNRLKRRTNRRRLAVEVVHASSHVTRHLREMLRGSFHCTFKKSNMQTLR